MFFTDNKTHAYNLHSIQRLFHLSRHAIMINSSISGKVGSDEDHLTKRHP